MRRGQMEIMGLAIIVILVSLGVLFALSIINKPTENIQHGYEQKRLAASFLNTMLGTTTGCQKNTFRQLLQDCAGERLAKCTSDIGNIRGDNSCQYINAVLNKQVLEIALVPENKQYYLTITGVRDIDTPLGKQCKGTKDQASQIIPASLGGNLPIRVTLDICDA